MTGRANRWLAMLSSHEPPTMWRWLVKMGGEVVASSRKDASTSLAVAGSGNGLLIPISTLLWLIVRVVGVLPVRVCRKQSYDMLLCEWCYKGTMTLTNSCCGAPDHGSYMGKGSHFLSVSYDLRSMFQHYPPLVRSTNILSPFLIETINQSKVLQWLVKWHWTSIIIVYQSILKWITCYFMGVVLLNGPNFHDQKVFFEPMPTTWS